MSAAGTASPLISASSSRARMRVSGVFRSCAMPSVVARSEVTSRSTSAKTRLMVSASRSYSSPRGETGNLSSRRPARKRCPASDTVSTKLKPRRLYHQPSARPSRPVASSDQNSDLSQVSRSAARSSAKLPTSRR
jgi:hypothetical protein